MATKPKSEKIRVIEYLYEKLTAEGRTVAMLSDVQQAIVTCNAQFGLSLSTSNPANFMKDLVRGKNASRNWPESLKGKKIGGRQRVGGGRALEFVPYGPDQTDAFENSFTRSADLVPVPLQSISLPLTAKRLGRKDESWLVQVTVALRVVEQHLAVRKSETLPEVLEVTHLQTGVKFGKSEVDALFLATCEIGGKRLSTLITCEAKQESERIVGHQIVGQVVAANRSVKLAGIEVELILPIAIQALTEPAGCIYVAEFEPWLPSQAELDEAALPDLVLAAEGLFELRPCVPGIGFDPRKK
ncbi:hypothetical protein JQ600_18345 [Bradyrhizobium sp. AUGA SZCCT0176]|uniref:hypothetical protein n=1 Tax=Bradyrhizobium sp. AUGA SZCCT0176 TaxID=2807664 RepID=UPI001BA8C0B0|nr:hypothetical protein [Bradyrhizobium sp. AUGA SZCCT0176]MBR1226892.1 hypothetical protein [Bradyrhizobium sp. AUGA SZCCT0176]